MTTLSALAPAALTDLDYELLDVLCRLRVVTQTQLERLHPDVPARTLRYRARRLVIAGLLGRSRPYRERGSAPHHLWPTRRADALMRGASPPRRGEREAPSPMFVAHSAAISELFVVLSTATGAPLVEFLREGEARRSFVDADGRDRAIAPDVQIGLRDGRPGAVARGNVEMDLGTMSHARLRTKLDGYLAHARAGGPTPVPVLFLTTHASRARTFLASARRALAAAGGPAPPIAVSDRARHLDAAVAERCWTVVTGDAHPRRLADVLAPPTPIRDHADPTPAPPRRPS
jgi:hypothetical protein